MQELLSSLHGEQGARLIQQWNLSPLYADVARHARTVPIGDEANPVHLIVRLVNNACTKLGMNLYQQDGLVLAASSEASALGVKEVVIAELEIMLEDGDADAGCLTGTLRDTCSVIVRDRPGQSRLRAVEPQQQPAASSLHVVAHAAPFAKKPAPDFKLEQTPGIPPSPRIIRRSRPTRRSRAPRCARRTWSAHATSAW